MWPWIKRWRDWAMNDLWSMHRMSPQPQALHHSYEKAGLTIHDQPIPWNADVVLVEALMRLPGASRRKADFQIHVPGMPALPAETLRRQEGDERYRLFFRLPTPAKTVTAVVHWRNQPMVNGQITLPLLTRDEFLDRLRLQMPTLFVRLEDHSVACQTFVSSQCRGLMASALLTSPTSLVPLLDLGLQVEFRSERGGSVQVVPAQLNSSQLAERQALIAGVPKRFPRRIGTWQATWILAGRPLATQRVRAISQRHFQRSLRISDTRFVLQNLKGKVSVARQMPPLEELARAGPCFLVSSGELGMAGLCRLQVRVQVAGAVQSPVVLEQDVLITDGPTMVAPGTLDVADLGQVSAFELQVKGAALGTLSTSPIPVANFTGEGGFKPSADYAWTAAADEELNERLTRLLEERSNQK
jgi:hypothetical protein